MTRRKTAASQLQSLLDPRFFKALGNDTRIGILQWLLLEGRDECTVNEIVDACSVGQSVVSRHLAMLRDVGILESERRGKEVFYRVRVTSLIDLLHSLADALSTCCPPRS